jgi:hypothetical protein
VRVTKVLVTVLALAALSVSLILFIGHRVELFVLPARLREVLRLHALCEEERHALNEEAGKLNPARSADDLKKSFYQHKEQLSRALQQLVRVQRPDFESAGFRAIEPMRTEEGSQAYVIKYAVEGGQLGETDLVTGLRIIAVDARGRLRGEAYSAPPWPGALCFVQHCAVETKENRPDTLMIGGSPACSFTMDSSGLVPRGALLQTCFPGGPSESAPRISSGNYADAQLWFESLHDPSPPSESTASLVASTRIGDLFRALQQIERAGPGASRMGLPLLVHPDPDLRARAAAVVGNDERLWADLLPLASDPAPQVKAAARFALLRAQDERVARKVFLELLRERAEGLEEVRFDHRRLLSAEVAATILDIFEEERTSSYGANRFWKDLRADDLRPLGGRIENLWRKRGQLSNSSLEAILARWLVLIDDPGLDPLLTRALEAEMGEPRGISGSILEALLDRPRPLAGQDAVRIILRGAEEAFPERDAILHYFVLIKWKVTGAEEKLLAKLRDPENRWLYDERVFDDHLPRELLPALKALAAEQPERYEERVKELSSRAR